MERKQGVIYNETTPEFQKTDSENRLHKALHLLRTKLEKGKTIFTSDSKPCLIPLISFHLNLREEEVLGFMEKLTDYFEPVKYGESGKIIGYKLINRPAALDYLKKADKKKKDRSETELLAAAGQFEEVGEIHTGRPYPALDNIKDFSMYDKNAYNALFALNKTGVSLNFGDIKFSAKNFGWTRKMNLIKKFCHYDLMRDDGSNNFTILEF